MNTKTCFGCKSLLNIINYEENTCAMLSIRHKFYNRRKTIRSCPCATCIVKFKCNEYCVDHWVHYYMNRKLQKRMRMHKKPLRIEF